MFYSWMNNRSHELATDTQVTHTALLPGSILNTNRWMLMLLSTSIQADKHPCCQSRETERVWGLDDSQSLLQPLASPVPYHAITPTEGHQKV